jgi:hypothetical protein
VLAGAARRDAFFEDLLQLGGLAASLAAVVGTRTIVISDTLPRATLVSLLTEPIFGSVA